MDSGETMGKTQKMNRCNVLGFSLIRCQHSSMGDNTVSIYTNKFFGYIERTIITHDRIAD